MLTELEVAVLIAIAIFGALGIAFAYGGILYVRASKQTESKQA